MTPELTGLAVVVLVLVVILSTWYGRARRRPQGPDVGLAVFVEDPTEGHEDDEDDEDDEWPWWYDDFDSTGAALAYYGSRLVHQKCLIARRDGLTACTGCAAILSAVTL